MKKAFQNLAYLTSLLLAASIAFKVNHYTGDTVISAIAGVFLALYFPNYILQNSTRNSEGKISAVNYALSLSLFFITLGASFKLAHLELGSLFILIGLASFCLIYAPLFYLQKSKIPDTNRLMWAAGTLAIACFPLGIFCRVYLGLDWGMQLFTVGTILLFVVFIPLYLFDKTSSVEEMEKRKQVNYFPIIIGFLLFFYLFKSIYPSQNDNNQEQPTKPVVKAKIISLKKLSCNNAFQSEKN